MSTGAAQPQPQVEIIDAKKKPAAERYLCDCGSEVSRRNISVHEKTAKHQKWVADQEEKMSPSAPVKTVEIGPMLREIWESLEELHDNLDDLMSFVGVPEAESDDEN